MGQVGNFASYQIRVGLLGRCQCQCQRKYSAVSRNASQLRSMHQYLASNSIFNVRRKTPSLTAGSRSSTGSVFPDGRTPTEKARRPSVQRRYRGTIKRCRLADRRCRQATSAMTVSLYPTRSGTLSHGVLYRYRTPWLSQ